MILGQSSDTEESEIIGPGGRGLEQIQHDEYMSSPQRATLTGNRGIRPSSDGLRINETSVILQAHIELGAHATAEAISTRISELYAK